MSVWISTVLNNWLGGTGHKTVTLEISKSGDARALQTVREIPYFRPARNYSSVSRHLSWDSRNYSSFTAKNDAETLLYFALREEKNGLKKVPQLLKKIEGLAISIPKDLGPKARKRLARKQTRISKKLANK